MATMVPVWVFFLGSVGDVKAGGGLCFGLSNLNQDTVLQRFNGHLGVLSKF